jgi:diguanylate cyclase (GGDEF)-like protein
MPSRDPAINDALSHHEGYGLLQGVAERLTKSLRAEDAVACLGGDEFVVLPV